MTKQNGLNSVRMLANGKKAEIMIYDVIGESFFFDGVTAKSVAESLAAIGSVEEIDVRINSPGGSVWQGMAIYNGLKNHTAKINVHIDGLAASMATIVAMAGDTISMAQNAMFMIHEPRTYAEGTAEDLLSQASLLEKLTTQAVLTYVSRTKMKEEDVREAMSAETWYTAEEAKAAGFITNIAANKQITAHFDVSKFEKAPSWAQSQMRALVAVPEKDKEQMSEQKTSQEPERKIIASEPLKTVDLSAERAQAAEQARKDERERVTKITALCKQAGKPEMADKFNEKGSSVTDVQSELFQMLCKSNAPVGEDGGAGEVAKLDENTKYREEFKAGQYSMTEEQYVSLRRCEDGLESFVQSKK